MNTSTPTDDLTAVFRATYQTVVDQTEPLPGQVPSVGLAPTPPRRPRPGWALVAVGLVVAAIVGVAVSRDRAPSAQSDDLAGFRAHVSRAAGGMDAIVSGVVEIDETTGCVWLSDPGGARYPVVWPRGTTTQADPLAIVLPDGAVASTGDRVEGGGGYVDALATTTGLGLPPFPAECVHVGETAVFNADSPVTVTPGEGVEVEDTLVTRFSPPQPIGLELIAVNPNQRSVALVDFVTGTVHLYQPGQYQAPADSIDGASGGGGFTHLWASGTVFTYWPIDEEPLVYQPESLIEVPGVAPSLVVVPAPDGDHHWLVQPGVEGEPTVIELVNLVGFEVNRVMTTEIVGSWRPMGSTTEGLVVTSGDPEPHTMLIGVDGSVTAEQEGTALSVGWLGAALLRPDGSLVVTNAGLESPNQVEKPGEGEWMRVGGPVIPATSPPLRTGTESYLVMLADEPEKGMMSSGSLVVVEPDGSAEPVYDFSEGPHLASWSRGLDWIVVVEGASVTLFSLADGSTFPLGDLVPEDHWVLTAG